jgi:hypothetical protein
MNSLPFRPALLSFRNAFFVEVVMRGNLPKDEGKMDFLLIG